MIDSAGKLIRNKKGADVSLLASEVVCSSPKEDGSKQQQTQEAAITMGLFWRSAKEASSSERLLRL